MRQDGVPVQFFSVVSRLRASAAHIVYMAGPALKDGKPVVRTDSAVEHLLLQPTVRWNGSLQREARVWALIGTGDSPVAVVGALAKQENELYEALHALDATYTLVLFPETQTRDETKVTRVVPFAAVRGVFSGTLPDGALQLKKGRVTRAEW